MTITIWWRRRRPACVGLACRLAEPRRRVPPDSASLRPRPPHDNPTFIGSLSAAADRLRRSFGPLTRGCR